MSTSTMRRWTSPKYAVWLLIACVAFFWILQSWILPNRERKSGATTFNESAQGMSIFKSFSDDFAPDRFELKKSAFFDAKELGSKGTLLIMAPRFPLSRRESKIIQEYVRRGGKLLLATGFNDKANPFEMLLLDMGIDVPSFSEDVQFQNRQTAKATPKQKVSIFVPEETYEFYSQSLFQDQQCNRDDPFRCFVRDYYLGDGQITLIAGLPIFSNVLIGKGDNRKALFRLFQMGSPLSVDEYHHFFSSYTLGDLLRNSRFSVPIFGFLLLTLLYFFFAHTRFHEQPVDTIDVPLSAGFHSLNERVLLSNLGSVPRRNEALLMQADVLRRILPRHHSTIDELLQKKRHLSPEQQSLELLQLHQRILADRRGRPL